MSGNAKLCLVIYDLIKVYTWSLQYIHVCNGYFTECCLFKESKKYVAERIILDTKRADFILERLGLYAREAKTRPENLE